MEKPYEMGETKEIIKGISEKEMNENMIFAIEK